MKKLLLCMLCLAMLLAMVACDSPAPVVPNVDGEDNTPSQNGGAETPNETPDNGQNDDNTPPPMPTEPVDPWMNVATYNIVRCADQAHPDQATHPDNIANFIVDNKIAICGLQEVEINSSRSMGWKTDEYYKDYGSHQPKYIAAKVSEKTGTQYYWAFAPALQGVHTPAHKDQGIAQYGNALISKYPIKDVRYVQMAVHEVDPNNPQTQLGANGYERRSLLIATLDVDGTDLTVIVTHFGLNESERELAVQKLKAELAVIETPVIFMGDLNCTYNSNPFRSIQQVLKSVASGATPASTPGGSRIDHIFISDNMSSRNVKSLPLNHSDHYPVLVKIKMPDAS